MDFLDIRLLKCGFYFFLSSDFYVNLEFDSLDNFVFSGQIFDDFSSQFAVCSASDISYDKILLHNFSF